MQVTKQIWIFSFDNTALIQTKWSNTHFLCCTVLYVRISVQCNRCKLKHQKTSAVVRGTVTVFNEVLVFSLPEFPVQQFKILVSVFETYSNRNLPKQMIGQLTMKKDNNSDSEHLDLMLRSVRQPIAKWHALLIWVMSQGHLQHLVDACWVFEVKVGDAIHTLPWTQIFFLTTWKVLHSLY